MRANESIEKIDGVFWTMVSEAESLFGKRDESWFLQEFIYEENGPELRNTKGHEPSSQKLSIVLSPNSRCDQKCRDFELSHEASHFLYPTGKRDANILNEGIATYFSVFWMTNHHNDASYALNQINKWSSYKEAYRIVEKLLDEDGEAIKKIRTTIKHLNYITKAELMSFGFPLSETEAERLVSPFPFKR